MTKWLYVVCAVIHGDIVEEVAEYENYARAKRKLQALNKKLYLLAWTEHRQTFCIVVRKYSSSWVQL